MTLGSQTKRTPSGVSATIVGRAVSAKEVEIWTGTPNQRFNHVHLLADDPNVTAAIHFCHGYGIGAWHYYVATTKPSSPTEIVCLSDPKPTRDEALAQYVAWARAHPQYLGEPAVDNLFRFLESTFPCTR